MLNSRSEKSNRLFNKPFTTSTASFYKDAIENYIKYLSSLKLNGVNILFSERKTGFLGFIINLTNIVDLFDDLQMPLYTYRLSQDHLELFFSAIRSRGGFNNNPSAYQFMHAYKKLIVRHQIGGFTNTNCIDWECTPILSVTKIPDSILSSNVCDEQQELLFDRIDSLDPFIEDIVNYIAGFVTKTIKRAIDCNICLSHCVDETSVPVLAKMKSRTHFAATKDVVVICKCCESIFRQNQNFIFKSNVLQSKCFQAVQEKVFLNDSMSEHICSQDLMFNHRIQLINYIIKKYLDIRLRYYGRCATEYVRVRSRLNKLILFKNQ